MLAKGLARAVVTEVHPPDGSLDGGRADLNSFLSHPDATRFDQRGEGSPGNPVMFLCLLHLHPAGLE
jgi:hypothetical protein